MPEIHAARRVRAGRGLAGVGADVALITDRINVRYLTGLSSSNAAVLLSASGSAVVATDSRYEGTARRDCPDLEVVIARAAERVLAERSAAGPAETLAFEAREMTVQRHAELRAAAGGLRWVPLGSVVEDLRVVKDDSEIELLERACAITDQAFEAVLGLIRPGASEREIAVAIERAMVDLGAQAPAFDTIVASGPNGAIPHHVPGERVLRRGDLVTIDCGALAGGYHADMTRTVALGPVARWQREIYDVTAAAQQAGVAAAVAGAAVAAVDSAARSLIGEAGHGSHFGHGLGHGVGLEIHEAPWIDVGRAGTLQERVAVTIEPGVYLPGAGGVRIEDTLVIRPGAGATEPAEPLTTITRDLLVV